jgi:hypothetical protein
LPVPRQRSARPSWERLVVEEIVVRLLRCEAAIDSSTPGNTGVRPLLLPTNVENLAIRSRLIPKTRIQRWNPGCAGNQGRKVVSRARNDAKIVFANGKSGLTPVLEAGMKTGRSGAWERVAAHLASPPLYYRQR